VKKKYPVDYHQSMNTVLAQEITRYNNVLVKINANVLLLRKAVKGLVVMSGPIETIGNSMFNNAVPEVWAAYPSLKPLASWVTNLESRIAFLQDWIDNGIPKVFWISGAARLRFFFFGCCGFYVGCRSRVLLPTGLHHWQRTELCAENGAADRQGHLRLRGAEGLRRQGHDLRPRGWLHL
jgi:hypothetical protein